MALKKDKLTRAQFRRLLFIQKGRCALSGIKLDPKRVSVDHIVPLSRQDLKNDPLYGKYWLVDTSVNKLKGNLSLDELKKIVDNINKNSATMEKLKEKLLKGKIEEMNIDDFNKYIEDNYDEDGIVKV